MNHRLITPDAETLARMRHLIAVSFGGRDALYAAARELDDETLSAVCERLAEGHAAHAIELQQRVAASGEQPPEPDSMMDRVVNSIMTLAGREDGPDAVLQRVQECESSVKKMYGDVLQEEKGRETAAVFRRQQRDVQFNENVIRAIREADDPTD